MARSGSSVLSSTRKPPFRLRRANVALTILATPVTSDGSSQRLISTLRLSPGRAISARLIIVWYHAGEFSTAYSPPTSAELADALRPFLKPSTVMSATTEDTDDISFQVAKQEAIAIMRGGLGEAELELVGSFCAPLYWVVGRLPDGSPIAPNGTAFFLNAGQGVFGVTACHVVHGWMSARRQGAGPLCVATNGNPLVIDWPKRVIAAHSGIDIATFRMSAQEVVALGKTVLTGFQRHWPPNPPAENCGIYYAGYPQEGTQPIGSQSLSFGLVAWFGRRQRRERSRRGQSL